MVAPLPILFRDEHVVAVDKPSGLLVHRGWGNDTDVAMMRVRDALGQHVNPVHRLDRATSGVLLFALTHEATSALGTMFADGRVKKIYRALVRGVPPDEGVIDSPVPKTEDGERVAAVTRYRLVAASTIDRCSLVEAMPETGRFHQIRRHLKHLGHPLLGDVNYGRGELNRHYRATYGLHRLALHACTLSFAHPITRAQIHIEAPLPDDLRLPFAALGLECLAPEGRGRAPGRGFA